MCTCIVDNQKVPVVDFWKLPLNRKFVAVFAETSRNVVNMVFRKIFFSAHLNLVVCSVHSGPHQICHGSVTADVLPVDVLLVDCLRYKPAVWTRNRSSALKADFHRIKTCGNNHIVVKFPDVFCNIVQIDFFLSGSVWDSDTAAQINELNVHSGFLLNFKHKLKDDFRSINKKVRVQLVGSDHCVKTEMLYSLGLADFVSLNHLFARETVFCLLGFSDDCVTAFLQRTRVVAEADCVGHFTAKRILQKRNVRDVVQVDYRPEFFGGLEFLCRSVVAREHDSVPGD